MRIKKVIRHHSQGSKFFCVGRNNVDVIKDVSIEYEDSVVIQFDAYDDKGKLIGSFINGIIDVEYFD